MASGFNGRLRIGALVERLRESLAAACLAGLLVGIAAGAWLGTLQGPTLVQAAPDRQFTFLTTLLSAIMTVIGVVLSIMVVAQQLASQQYSPRAIRTTLRDKATRSALGGLFGYVGFMVGAIAVFGPSSIAPWSVPVGMLLSVGALGLVAYLIQHITDGFRSDRLVARIGRDTMAAVHRIAERDDEEDQRDARIHGLDDIPEHARVLRASRSGYLQDVALSSLAHDLADLGVRLRLTTSMGAFVGARTGIGWFWSEDGQADRLDHDEVQQILDTHLRVGTTRTTQREIGSGVQQLVDVALKGLSPGINDPQTAVQAIDTLTRVLQQLAERRQDWLVGVVEEDLVVTIPRPLVWDFVDQSVGEVRRVAGGYPTVLDALIMVLRAVAATRPQDADRVEAHLEAIMAEAERASLLPIDLDAVKRLVESARAELANRSAAAREDADQQSPDS